MLGSRLLPPISLFESGTAGPKKTRTGDQGRGDDTGSRLRPECRYLRTQDALTVILEMPGVEKSNVDVRVEDGVLSVLGKLDLSKYQGLQPLYIEYNVGHYSRSFQLAGSNIRGEWFPRPRRGSSASRALLARSGELAYSADAARKPAINRMKVTAHQRTSLGMAEIIGYTHRGLAASAIALMSLVQGAVHSAN
jgi:Hsp20/alpha crystallin family